MIRQRLTIRISPDSLLFLVSDGQQAAMERYPLNSSFSVAANMREALRTVPCLQEAYNRVTVSADGPCMLAPTELFHEQKQEPWYHYTFSGQDQQAVMNYVIPDLNAVALFSLQKDLRMVITDHFGTVRFAPVMASVWQHLYAKSFTGARAKLYGHLHDRKLDVFAFSQNRFKFCNTFPIGHNAANATYYLLSAWKQLGMAPSEDELHLSGEFAEKEQLAALVGQYVKRVFVNNPSGEFNRAAITQIEGIPYDLVVQYMRRLS